MHVQEQATLRRDVKRGAPKEEEGDSPKPTKPQPKRLRKAKKPEKSKRAEEGSKTDDDEDGAQESMDEALEREDAELKQERELDEEEEADAAPGARKPVVPIGKPPRRKAKKSAGAPANGAKGAEALDADDEKKPKEKKRKEAEQEQAEDKGPDDLNEKKPAKSRRTGTGKASKVKAETGGSKEDQEGPKRSEDSSMFFAILTLSA